ncbi:mitochondrial ribosomal death-associated protein 3-domain-containing protein [Chytridium lagenaria]|nr:mitochondrial ribosomal death-associated protein 3-domain-containing protein [Chytridium lagenaria]
MLVSSIRCASRPEPESKEGPLNGNIYNIRSFEHERAKTSSDSGEIITEESKASVPQAADFKPTIIAENVPRWKTENANPELIGNFYQVIPSLDKFRGEYGEENCVGWRKGMRKEFGFVTSRGTFIWHWIILFSTCQSGSLKDLVESGINNSESSHVALKAVLGELLDNAGSRPPFIIAVDQLNALFTKTAYHDTDSTILLSDRFELINAFQEVLEHKKGMNAKFEDISDVDAFGVLLPRGIAKADGDGFVREGKVKPVGLERVETPTLERREVESFLRYYAAMKVFYGKVNKSLVERVWILTGGNARKLVASTQLLK